MPARDAAVAFVTDCPDKGVTGIKFEIDDPDARPPSKGEIGLRWIGGSQYAPRQEGVTILRFDGHKSALLMSHIEVVGRRQTGARGAVMKTDFHEIRRLVAQQTYEILWWLRHVQSVGSSSRDSASSSNDGLRTFLDETDGR